jgi:hypothetical protein
VAIAGPFTIEVAPSWIFGSPYANVDTKGFSVAANATFYISGRVFDGFWVKAHVGYENYSATLTNSNAPDLVGEPQRVSTAILGAMFGNTQFFGKNGGFALSGGIGIGVATAHSVTLDAPGDLPRGIAPEFTTLLDGFDRIRLLGSLGLGVAF